MLTLGTEEEAVAIIMAEVLIIMVVVTITAAVVVTIMAVEATIEVVITVVVGDGAHPGLLLGYPLLGDFTRPAALLYNNVTQMAIVSKAACVVRYSPCYRRRSFGSRIFFARLYHVKSCSRATTIPC